MSEHDDPWADAPSSARWYGEVIAAPPVGNVDYFYGFSVAASAPDVAELTPNGWTVLEAKLEGTSSGRSAGVSVLAEHNPVSGVWTVSWTADGGATWMRDEVREDDLPEAWDEACEAAGCTSR